MVSASIVRVGVSYLRSTDAARWPVIALRKRSSGRNLTLDSHRSGRVQPFAERQSKADSRRRNSLVLDDAGGQNLTLRPIAAQRGLQSRYVSFYTRAAPSIGAAKGA